MTTLTELATMLDAATGPSRELDERIWAYDHGWDYPIFGSAIGSKRDCRDNGEKQDYTGSIDAALALVERLLPGWEWSLWRVGETCGATLYNAPDNELEPSIALQATTAPLAILKALIAAVEAEAAPEAPAEDKSCVTCSSYLVMYDKCLYPRDGECLPTHKYWQPKPAEAKSCGTCGGLGLVARSGDKYYSGNVKCPACDGEGKTK